MIIFEKIKWMKTSKILLIVFISLIVLIGVPLIIAFFLPTNYAVERSVNIHQNADSVYHYVKFLKNQNQYSVWQQMDPKARYSYSGTDGKVGFIARWESDSADIGVGEQEIMKLYPNEKIVYEIRFEKPWKSVSPAFMATTPLDSLNTKVTWGFEGKMDYPMNLMLLLMDIDKAVGNDLQEGLNNLKSILEENKSP